MIHYLLAAIALILIVLVGYTQLNKGKTPISINQSVEKLNTVQIKRQNLQNQETLENNKKEVSSNTVENFLDTDKMSEFNKEMAQNEKEIIRKSLSVKETLSRIYDPDVEENVPTGPVSLVNQEEYSDISMDELDKIEKENNLQPQVVEMPSIQEDIQGNTPMTEDELDNAEKTAGMQDILEDNSEPLDKKDILF